MPVAKVYVPEGTLTLDQRREIVKGIHDGHRLPTASRGGGKAVR